MRKLIRRLKYEVGVCKVIYKTAVVLIGNEKSLKKRLEIAQKIINRKWKLEVTNEHGEFVGVFGFLAFCEYLYILNLHVIRRD